MSVLSGQHSFPQLASENSVRSNYSNALDWTRSSCSVKTINKCPNKSSITDLQFRCRVAQWLSILADVGGVKPSIKRGPAAKINETACVFVTKWNIILFPRWNKFGIGTSARGYRQLQFDAWIEIQIMFLPLQRLWHLRNPKDKGRWKFLSLCPRYYGNQLSNSIFQCPARLLLFLCETIAASYGVNKY